jgi:hypothetical protein
MHSSNMVSPELCYLFTCLKLTVEHAYLNTLLRLIGEINKSFEASLKSAVSLYKCPKKLPLDKIF